MKGRFCAADCGMNDSADALLYVIVVGMRRSKVWRCRSVRQDFIEKQEEIYGTQNCFKTGYS